jgi:hypothetical protein
MKIARITRRAIAAHVECHRRRQLTLDRRQQRLDRVDGLHDVDAGLFLDRQVHAALAVLPARRLVVLDAVEHVRHFIQPNGIAVAIRDDRRAVRGAAQQLSVGLDDECALAVDGASRQVGVRVLNR